MTSEQDPQYSIGVVARRANVHPETLRVWERRYDLITPGRSDSGRRLYSEADVLKVSLVKQLTEMGHAVSTLAPLQADRLQELLATTKPAPVEESTPPRFRYRILLLDDALRMRIARDLLRDESIEIVDRNTLGDGSNTDEPVDIVILDIPTINEQSLDHIRRTLLNTSALNAFVVYKFSTRAAVDHLERAGVTCLKGMVTAGDVLRACRTLKKKPEVVRYDQPKNQVLPVKPRRFDNAALARAASLSSSIACECPNHLAELIINLAAFEQYSSECANKNAQDVALHKQLYQSASLARSILEESLARVIEVEGIQL